MASPVPAQVAPAGGAAGVCVCSRPRGRSARTQAARPSCLLKFKRGKLPPRGAVPAEVEVGLSWTGPHSQPKQIRGSQGGVEPAANESDGDLKELRFPPPAPGWLPSSGSWGRCPRTTWNLGRSLVETPHGRRPLANLGTHPRWGRRMSKSSC